LARDAPAIREFSLRKFEAAADDAQVFIGEKFDSDFHDAGLVVC
jgi:hypothetical protein